MHNLFYYIKRLFRIKSKRQKDEETKRRIVTETNDLLDMLSKLPDYALVDISERYTRK